MFNIEASHALESSTDVYSDNDNMDIIMNVENEFMSSEFFDIIKSVENGIDSNLLNSSEGSFMGSLSPTNDLSESEKSYTDTSVSPSRSLDTGDDSLLEFLQLRQDDIEIPANLPVFNLEECSEVLIQNSKRTIKEIPVPTVKRSPKVVKFQTVSKHGKPIILPYGLKNVKILNASDLKRENITLKAGKLHRIEPSPLQRTETVSRHALNDLSEVKLTNEEKRLLEKEGIKLPNYHPLTKAEDRELKRIRRKIRNKISAQDSRKRKKEYVDGLEDRVRRGSEENRNLMQRIKELQRKNKTLRAHINKLHSMLFNSSSSNAAPSTCLMIIILSVLLVSIPNFNQMKMKNDLSEEQEQVTISRSLLSTKILDDDGLKADDFSMFGKNVDAFDMENKTEEEILESLRNMENHYNQKTEAGGIKDVFVDKMMNFMKYMFNAKELPAGMQQIFNVKGFIEPGIDDCEDVPDEPPVKKKCSDNYHYMQNAINVKTTIPGGANDK